MKRTPTTAASKVIRIEVKAEFETGGDTTDDADDGGSPRTGKGKKKLDLDLNKRKNRNPARPPRPPALRFLRFPSSPPPRASTTSTPSAAR
jgi:hypothetical protein